MKADKALTLARHFLDYRSFVRSDNSEVLYGLDWKARVEELRQRCGGRCEYLEPGVLFMRREAELLIENGRCTKEAAIPAHIIPRYPKRDDRMSNLKGYCIEHDKLMEKQSWRRICSDKAERRVETGATE